ncbi:hypothetical protein Hdeb2414_s0006g00207261 [Helianthus debilis subsp. tardiflorus]
MLCRILFDDGDDVNPFAHERCWVIQPKSDVATPLSSMANMNVTFLNQLNVYSKNVTIKVKIVKLWRRPITHKG